MYGASLCFSAILLLATRDRSQTADASSANRDRNQTTFSANAEFLKVLNLNFWGLPWPWGADKDYRIQALREELLQGDYDIVLLQEVWYRGDYSLLQETLPYITRYESMNSACSSFLLPLGCSGLTVLSKHPIIEEGLIPFSQRGNFWRFDGEVFVRKGVGVARIKWKDMTIDVFTTHLVSYSNTNQDNRFVRYLQTLETINIIARSDADIAIFGGDVNAPPLEGPRQPYAMLCSVLTDSMTDKYPGASTHPVFASFGNVENSYTGGSPPERIDYLMYRPKDNIKMRTYDFSMPLFMTHGVDGKIISLSDHEALFANFIVEKKRNNSLPRILDAG